MQASPLQHHLATVRRAWRRVELLKALALLIADASVAVLVLAIADAIYHVPKEGRVYMLGLAVGLLTAIAIMALKRGLGRRLSDVDVALYVEERFPELRGSLIAAVEYESRPAENAVQQMLFSALMRDCLARAAKIDLAHAIDRRRLSRRVAVMSLLAIALMSAAVLRPQLAGHELARVLAPWVDVPLNEAETAALQKKQHLHQLEAEIQRQTTAATQPTKIELSIEPGDAQVKRGGSLRVIASANRVAGPFSLQFHSADGQWQTLSMSPDAANPDHFEGTLSDLTESARYKVSMGGADSREFNIEVFDPTTVKQVQLIYHFPKYSRLPDATVTGNLAIEALQGTQVEVRLTTSAPLKDGSLQLNDGSPTALKPRKTVMIAMIPVEADGHYQLSATDLRGQAVVGLDQPWTITAILNPPPTLSVLYPVTEAPVHPLEEIAFAAKVEDTVGLKELRLITAFGEENPVVQKIDYAKNPQNVKLAIGQFTLDLSARKKVETADTIVFHFEVEDLKGQVTSSEVTALTVRDLELFATYEGMHAHDAGEALIDLLGAIKSTHDVGVKRPALTAEEFKKLCEQIAKENLEKPKQQAIGKMIMKKHRIIRLAGKALAGITALAMIGAAPLRKIEAPEGVVLNPAQQKLLDEGNSYVDKGYILLVEKNDPQAAMAEFRKALRIQAKIDALAPLHEKAGVAPEEAGAEEAFKRTAQSMQALVEITTVEKKEDVSKNTEKNKAAKQAQAQAKKAAEVQKQISKDLANAQPQSKSEGDASAKADQKAKSQDAESEKAQAKAAAEAAAGTDAKSQSKTGLEAEKKAGAGTAQASAGADAKPQSKTGSEAEKKAVAQASTGTDAKPQSKAGSDAEKKAAAAAAQAAAGTGAKPDSKSGSEAEKHAGAAGHAGGAQADAKTAKTGMDQEKNNAGSKTAAGAAAKAKDGAVPESDNGESVGSFAGAQAKGAETGNDAKAQAKAGEAPQPNADAEGHEKSDAAGSKAGAADRQAQVAKELRDVADKLGADAHTASAFNRAAAMAAANAEQIRQGKMIEARTQSEDVERAIADAIRLASRETEETLLEAVRSLELELADVKDRQNVNLSNLEELQKPSPGGEADLRQKADKTNLVAALEAQLKSDVDEVQRQLTDLIALADQSAGRTQTGAAREHMSQALQVLTNSRIRQTTIDATLDVRAGDFAASTESMAKVAKSLQDTYEQIVAATSALSAGQSAAKRDYRELQRISSAFRQISGTVRAFATTSQARGDKSPAVPQSVLQLLNKSAEKVRGDLLVTVSRPNAAAMPALAGVKSLAQKPVQLSENLPGTLAQLDGLIGSVETLEGQLAGAIEQELAREATRDYMKDPIPPAYQKPVSEYFEALSKDSQKH